MTPSENSYPITASIKYPNATETEENAFTSSLNNRGRRNQSINPSDKCRKIEPNKYRSLKRKQIP